MTDPLAPTPGARNNSASLRRALGILLSLADDRAQRGYTLGELAEHVSLSKPTVLRLLQPLVDAHFVQLLPTGTYRLGWRNAQLGQAYLAGTDPHRDMRDVLERLSARTSETVHLVKADFPRVVYIDKVDSPLPVRMASRIGSTQPAYCTSVGKAMLAHADEDVVDSVIAAGMPARTANTITSGDALRSELAASRARGWAVDDIENEVGVRCVAAPIFDPEGTATSAISVSAPEERMPPSEVERVAPLVRAAAQEISLRWGTR
ncbi:MULTISPECIES: IclR family transcriptional regulator [unclassified Streptomyces]|uniref:IclR family transcriptional regulator n=1 Tax=unclassified Streptomyces TaxID=2593676 RepID=UPI00093970F3|nr:IclR family transcriptional regulator [Streptomyces sp. TSRI0281]OKI40760.1 IclR family transcriptional regulator [Streptomyces sp. TSRI0281]